MGSTTDNSVPLEEALFQFYNGNEGPFRAAALRVAALVLADSAAAAKELESANTLVADDLELLATRGGLANVFRVLEVFPTAGDILSLRISDMWTEHAPSAVAVAKVVGLSSGTVDEILGLGSRGPDSPALLRELTGLAAPSSKEVVAFLLCTCDEDMGRRETLAAFQSWAFLLRFVSVPEEVLRLREGLLVARCSFLLPLVEQELPQQVVDVCAEIRGAVAGGDTVVLAKMLKQPIPREKLVDAFFLAMEEPATPGEASVSRWNDFFDGLKMLYEAAGSPPLDRACSGLFAIAAGVVGQKESREKSLRMGERVTTPSLKGLRERPFDCSRLSDDAIIGHRRLLNRKPSTTGRLPPISEVVQLVCWKGSCSTALTRELLRRQAQAFSKETFASCSTKIHRCFSVFAPFFKADGPGSGLMAIADVAAYAARVRPHASVHPAVASLNHELSLLVQHLEARTKAETAVSEDAHLSA